MSVVKKILRESPTEYFLQVPYAEKDRAKRIQGYVWNGVQKCWVFHKGPRVYDAIISEFGEELDNQTSRHVARDKLGTDVEVADPRQHTGSSTQEELSSEQRGAGTEVNSASSSDTSIELSILHAQLKQAIEANKGLVADWELLANENAKLNEQASARRTNPDVQGIEQELEKYKRRVSDLSRQHRESEVRIRELLDNRASDWRQVAKLQDENRRLSDSNKQIQQETVLTRRVFPVAVAAAESNAKFENVIHNHDIDVGLAIAIAVALEDVLAKQVTNRGHSDDLDTLIKRAGVERILQPDQLELAQVIRRQRNLLSHNTYGRQSTAGRVLLILFAAALLWPALPRN